MYNKDSKALVNSVTFLLAVAGIKADENGEIFMQGEDGKISANTERGHGLTSVHYIAFQAKVKKPFYGRFNLKNLVDTANNSSEIQIC